MKHFIKTLNYLPCVQRGILGYGSHDLNHRCFTNIRRRTLNSSKMLQIRLILKQEENASEPGLKAFWNVPMR